MSCYQRAASLFAEIGDRTGRAETLIHLADTRSAAGSQRAAVAVWREALRLLDDLHHPDVDQVRDKLSRATAPVSSLSYGPASRSKPRRGQSA